MQVREHQGRISFLVRAQPGAHRSEIVGEWQGALRVRLAAEAQEGQANEALRRFLADRLKVPLAAVEIVHGQRSRSKRIEIAGITAAQVNALLLPAES